MLTDATLTRTHDTITTHVRLAGGQHHTLTLPMPKSAAEQRKTPPNIVSTVDELLDRHTTGQIADILNQRGLTSSGTRQPFHRHTIDRVSRTYQLRSRKQRLRDAGMLTLTEIATQLGVSTATVKTWHHTGIVSSERYNDKGEYLYHPADPDNPPTPHQGHPLTSRPPAQTQQTAASRRKGAV